MEPEQASALHPQAPVSDLVRLALVDHFELVVRFAAGQYYAKSSTACKPWPRDLVTMVWPPSQTLQYSNSFWKIRKDSLSSHRFPNSFQDVVQLTWVKCLKSHLRSASWGKVIKLASWSWASVHVNTALSRPSVFTSLAKVSWPHPEAEVGSGNFDSTSLLLFFSFLDIN